jgi:hypothetical protein
MDQSVATGHTRAPKAAASARELPGNLAGRPFTRNKWLGSCVAQGVFCSWFVSCCRRPVHVITFVLLGCSSYGMSSAARPAAGSAVQTDPNCIEQEELLTVQHLVDLRHLRRRPGTQV